MADYLALIQTFSMLMAAGTPGMTYYVINRMHKAQILSLQENCKNCRKTLDDKIAGLDESTEFIELRQKELREEILPDDYVKRRELEALAKTHEKDIQVVHKRIDRYYHPAVKGT
jgi:hypothetical protein